MTNALVVRHPAVVALGVGATMAFVAGCHVGPHAKAGAGESTNICTAIGDYNALAEPVVTNRSSVTAYLAGAQRALRRVDGKQKYAAIDGTKRLPAAQILTTVAADRAAYDAEAKLVAMATTPATLHSAVQGFAASTGFSSADTALELWATSNCA